MNSPASSIINSAETLGIVRQFCGECQHLAGLESGQPTCGARNGALAHILSLKAVNLAVLNGLRCDNHQPRQCKFTSLRRIIHSAVE